MEAIWDIFIFIKQWFDNKYEWFEIIFHSKHLKLKTDNDEKKERELGADWEILLLTFPGFL